jgi:calmodulin
MINQSIEFSFDKEQLELLKQSFTLYDKDKDGIISIKELGNFMRSSNQYSDEDNLQAALKDIINKVDTDGDGKIDFKEYLQMMAKQLQEETDKRIIAEANFKQQIKEAFDEFDKDGSGFISATELRDILKKYDENKSQEEINEMIREVDTNSDGQINFEEFEIMMTPK